MAYADRLAAKQREAAARAEPQPRPALLIEDLIAARPTPVDPFTPGLIGSVIR